MSTKKKIRELEAAIKKMQKDNARPFGDYSTKRRLSDELLQFLLGLVLLGAGLFWVLQAAAFTIVLSPFMLVSFAVPSGVIVIPFLVGIAMLFFCKRKILGWIVLLIGVISILISIITSVRFYFAGTSLFSYILMFGFIAAGCGLLIKTLFKKS